MRRNWQLLALSLTLILAVFGLGACNRDRGVEAARENATPSASPAEQDFMFKATQANVAEIDLARLAQQKSNDGDVKEYANMIESDHKKALDNLADLMQDKHVQLQKAAPTEAQQEISRMNTLTGPDFDREFVNMMVSDHQKALELFRTQQASAQDKDVKDYVDDVLPTLENHLDKAQQLQSRLFNAPPAPGKR